jgi:branched-chain amino acid transport system substrate-binding protein
MRPIRQLLLPILLVSALAGAVIADVPLREPAQTPIRIGAVFPLTTNAEPLAKAELTGVQIAADLVNARGGIDGRPIELDVRDLSAPAAAGPVMHALKASGITTVIGAYSSDLSIAASSAAASEGLLYWEAGAVADRLTGRGLPLVFRVGASGSTLGTQSSTFAAQALAPRLGKAPGQLSVAIVNADDDYASSVAAAADRTAAALGMPVVARLTYHVSLPIWDGIMASLTQSHPDVIILASHIPDGIAFRRAMLAAGVKTEALIGSTMAECVPDFAAPLGSDAIGIFGSDRPAGGFDPGPLDPEARALYEQFASAWKDATAGWLAPTEDPGEYGGGPTPSGDVAPGGESAWSGGPAPGGDAAPTGAGPSSPEAAWGSNGGDAATEEGLAGFSAGWALFRNVLPTAASEGRLDPEGIAAVARAVDLPNGSLPSGAGLRFSADPATLGQNERAIGMVWQWQAVNRDVVVWPQSFATGSIAFVPLPR